MRRFSFLVLCAVLLVGCSDRSFIGKQYNNFTAYYNTFYNAQKAFEKGVEAIDQSEQPINRTTYLSLFGAPPQSANTQAFEDAISKSADVLRDHPNSKWVDDALMMIGKSYFYQRNYVGAEQKFREVMGLNSELEGEARFWLARALIAAGRYAAADEHLRTSLSQQDEDFGRWEAMMSLAQGELAVKRENWSAAAEALARGLEGDVGGEDAARAAFLLGQVQETLGNFDAATTAYERSTEYRSRYELNYAARISAIRTKGLHGQPDEALADLRDMETDDKNFEKRAELRLLRGRLYQATGRLDEARRIYRDLLYGDDASRQGTVSGRVHYALGELYRDAYQNFSVAAAHFDTASTSISRPSGQGNGEQEQPTAAPAAITDSREQATTFGEVADKADAVTRLDSLLRLGTMEEQEFRSFIADLREQRAQEQAAREQAARERESARRFNTSGTASSGQRDGGDSPTTAAAATSSGDSGFLFHNDPVRVQEARRSFEQQWGRRPLVPNWRRREAVVARTSSSDDSAAAPESADSLAAAQPGAMTRNTGATGGSGTPERTLVDISEVPRDSASQAEMRKQQAVARYELGNALFLAANRPDSAITWYRRVVENDHNESVARRALYALAEAHSALGDTTEARRLYRRLLTQYPDSEFAARAREQLGEAPATQAAPSDSTALAETAYASAYDAWQNDRHDTALQQMVRVAEAYPRTKVAPRALLAAGSIFMEQHPPDSLTATTPLPDIFTSILEAQPKTAAAPDSTQQLAPPSDSTQAPPPDSTRRSMEVPETIQDRGPRRDSTRRPPVRRDSARRAPPADSTAMTAPPDSASAPSASADSMAADSTALRPAVADSARVDSARVDSARVDSSRIDSSAVRADSLRSVSAVDSTAADSVAQASAEEAVPSGPVLRMLYAHITEQYPDSPQADRANRVLKALDGAAAAADSAATPASDTTANVPADSAAMPSVTPDSVASDSARAPAPPDSLRTPPSDTLNAPPADSAAARSDSTALPPPPSPRAQPDTTATPPDTSGALPGPRPAPPDSSAQQRN